MIDDRVEYAKFVSNGYKYSDDKKNIILDNKVNELIENIIPTKQNIDKQILEDQLNKVYVLLKTLPNSKIKGTTEFKIVYELEEINMQLNIPFND